MIQLDIISEMSLSGQSIAQELTTKTIQNTTYTRNKKDRNVP